MNNTTQTIRERLGLTRAEFAKVLGVTARTILNWETGAVKVPRPVFLLFELTKDKPSTLLLMGIEKFQGGAG